MPTELNSLTQSYIKIQKCMNASFNSHDYKFFKSLLNDNELDCLKHLQHLKHYHTYRSNSIRKKNQEILDNIVNDETNNNSDLIDKPIKRQKKIIDSDSIIPKSKTKGKGKGRKKTVEDENINNDVTDVDNNNVNEPEVNVEQVN